MNFREYLNESPVGDAKLAQLRAKQKPKKPEAKVTQSELNKLESVLDKLFKGLKIDIEFTRHFLERVNDARNVKNISITELNALFTKAHKKYGVSLSHKPDDFQAVLKSITTNINIPFVININRNGEIELVAKTIMRKKNFASSNQELKV